MSVYFQCYIVLHICTVSWLRNYLGSGASFYSWSLTARWHSLVSSLIFFTFWHCFHQGMHEITPWGSSLWHQLSQKTGCYQGLENLPRLSFCSFFPSRTPVCYFSPWTGLKKTSNAEDIDYLDRKISFHVFASVLWCLLLFSVWNWCLCDIAIHMLYCTDIDLIYPKFFEFVSF